MGKPFCKDLYNEYDTRVKIALIAHLNSDLFFTRSKEDYGPDIKALKRAGPGFEYVLTYHEVEVKRKWDGGKFTEQTLNIPYRKKRLLEVDPGVPLYFWVVSNNYKQAYWINRESLKEEYVKTIIVPMPKGGKEEKGPDKFYMIPLKYWNLVELKGMTNEQRKIVFGDVPNSTPDGCSKEL